MNRALVNGPAKKHRDSLWLSKVDNRFKSKAISWTTLRHHRWTSSVPRGYLYRNDAKSFTAVMVPQETKEGIRLLPITSVLLGQPVYFLLLMGLLDRLALILGADIRIYCLA
jgi:hypothetical protein